MRPSAQAMRSAPPWASSVSRSRALIPFDIAGSAVWGAENYTYTEAAPGLVAWLNEKIANSSSGALHVAAHRQRVARHCKPDRAAHWAESRHPGARHERSSSDYAQLAEEESRPTSISPPTLVLFVVSITDTLSELVFTTYKFVPTRVGEVG